MKLNTSIKTNNRLTVALITSIALTAISTSHAALVTVVSDASWTQSTTTIADVDGTNDWVTNVTTAPPAVGTFTTPVTTGGGGGVTAAVGTNIGATSITTGYDITYYRTTFTLSPFTTATATVTLPLDNAGTVWINGSFVASEISYSVDNWVAPYSSFDIASDGTVVNPIQFDDTSGSATFVAGTNEVILAVRNLPAADDGNPAGGFAFRMDVTTVAVPEPSSTALLGLGAVALLLKRRRN